MMAKKADKKADIHAVDGLTVLTHPTDYRPLPVTVLAGGDGYLRHEVRRALIQASATDGELPFVEVLDGKRAELRDVLDAVAERSLFGDEGRLVVLEDADVTIKQYRAQFEAYASAPHHAAVLILEVPSWPGNTKLAKQVAQTGLTVHCQVPQQGRELTAFQKQHKAWLIAVASREYDAELESAAADLLLEKIPPQPGLTYQEIAKLALLASPPPGSPPRDARPKIDAQLVRDQVGSWRARKTWDMIDAAAEGRAAEALDQLDRLVAAGEVPHAILPQMAASLRHFAMAVHLFQQAEQRGQRPSLRDCLERAGTPKFKLGDAQRQLQQIGRHRALQLYDWLLAADLELKGHNSAGDRPRRVLETLIVKLAKQSASQSS